MPKRKHDQNKEDKWRKKLRKYEKKLSLNARQVSSSDEDDGWAVRSHPTLSRRTSIESGYDRLRQSTSPMPPDHESDPIVPDPVVSTESPVPTTSDAVEPPVIQSSEKPANDGPSVDPELLSALGEFEGEQIEWGPDIVEALAERWLPVLRQGLKKETKEDLIKKHLIPKNCALLKPPILNAEISAMLTESGKNRDSRLEKKQAQIGCALAILGRVMSDMLSKSVDSSKILGQLSDVTKLLTDSRYLETETRRSLIIPTLDKTFVEAFKDRRRDSHLFGDKLGDFIKSSRGIQKVGKMMQPASTSSRNNLNSRGPPPSRNYPQQRYPRNPARGVAGGQRRRRGNFQLPPPPDGRPGRASPQPSPARQRAAAPSNKPKQ